MMEISALALSTNPFGPKRTSSTSLADGKHRKIREQACAISEILATIGFSVASQPLQKQTDHEHRDFDQQVRLNHSTAHLPKSYKTRVCQFRCLFNKIHWMLR